MADLGVDDLRHLSPMMSGRSARWVETYRDGLLRDKIFASDLLIQTGQRMRGAAPPTASPRSDGRPGPPA